MANISGTSIKKRTIDVLGIFGDFSIKPSHEDVITVKYFQTIASRKQGEEAGNVIDLLRELKPMRERVKSKDIKDLRSLLQRDLNDFRVANELIPYLQGINSKVGFFPSILVALIPKKFLEENSNAKYPKTSQDQNNQLIKKYDEYWEIEQYAIENKKSSLGILRVDNSKTDFIVLDGQHRANAFRYMAGTFEDATSDSSIYSVFYQHCEQINHESFNAELPVTIVWFESDREISPQLISRKLFVDVNTTAQKVSKSRNILLDDRDIASVSTTCIYSILATNGYSLDELSLLHSGFDCDGDFPNGFPKMALFSPSILHYMLQYLLLTNKTTIGETIQRQARVFSNYGELKDFCSSRDSSLKDETLNGIKNGNHNDIENYTILFREKAKDYIINLYNSFIFFKPHFESCKKLEQEINEKGTAEVKGAWDKVFKGGEGLYSVFESSTIDQRDRLNTYRQAVNQIDQSFDQFRKQLSGDDNYVLAINTLLSIAGTTGIFMALKYYSNQKGWNQDTFTTFINAINGYDVKQWILILTDYKKYVVGENTPKLWPKNRDIFLRFIESKIKDSNFYPESSLTEHHPDFIYCINKINEFINSYHNANPDEKPNEEIVNRWVMSVISSLNLLINNIGAIAVNEEKLKQKIDDHILNKIKKNYPDDNSADDDSDN